MTPFADGYVAVLRCGRIHFVLTRGPGVRAGALERSERGPHRVVFRTTAGGRRALRAWLAEPVEHVRETRLLFLLELVLAARAGIDRRAMILAQRDVLAPSLAALEEKLGSGSEAEEITLRFRLETTRSVLHFLDDLLADTPALAESST